MSEETTPLPITRLAAATLRRALEEPIRNRPPLHDHRVQASMVRALAEIPEVTAFVTALRPVLGANGFALAEIPELSLLPSQERDTVAVAVSALLGVPSPVGDSDIVVWDVRPAPHLPTEQRLLNVSVSVGEACLHTDSTFAAPPERWFGLWCLRPAERGGANLLVDGARTLSALDRRARHQPALREALRTLRTDDVPLWDGRQIRTIRVLGPAVIRFRDDLVKEGIAKAGLAANDPRVRAVRALRDAFERSPFKTRVRLERDEVLFVDNHRTLHAREHFEDPRRHLLRVRMHGFPLLENAGLAKESRWA